MRYPRLLASIVCLSLALPGVLTATPAKALPPIRLVDPTPAALAPDEAQYLYLAPGVVTSVCFDTNLPIGKITMGDALVDWKYMPAERRLDLWPKVREGTTNIQVPIGRQLYVIIIQIGQRDASGRDALVQAVRHYSVGGEAESQDLSRIAAAPVIEPTRLRVSDFVKSVEKAQSDPVYRATLNDFRDIPIGRSYDWNNSLVTLTNVFAFVDRDVALVKVVFRNDTENIVRFFGTQIRLLINGKEIPVQVVYQRSAAMEPECAIKPGDIDTCYLVLQGQKLSPRNPFQIQLPPDAAAIEAWTRRTAATRN